MKAFVTGGTGFIGKHVVRKLVERGYDVVALARSDSSATALRAAGARSIEGDITDRASLRAGMEGADLVIHLAAWYKIGSDGWMKAETINVGGTRNVLKTAVEVGVPRIVYASTVEVLGDTGGQLVDENYQHKGHFLSEYERTKWLAHYKVAEPLIEQGAPIIIVMPGGVYGPGDTNVIGQLMKMFYQGNMPILAGPETTMTFAHVEDIAEGILLAAEKGEVGESYVLAGPAVPLGEMVDFWSYLTGRSAPALRVPARYVKPLAPAVGAVTSVLPLPPTFSREALENLGATFMARADKARTELGWKPRPLQAGMLETFEWLERTSPPALIDKQQRRAGGLALIAAAILFMFWWFNRNDKSGE